MFGRKRPEGERCTACDRSLKPEQKVCACGSATKFMTFEERTAYEVDQWRRYRQRPAEAQAG